MKTAKSVSAYISLFPKDVRGKLHRMRKAIREAAPGAAEGVSYGMPYFSLQGRLCYFAAFKNHISIFVPPPAIEQNRSSLKSYVTSRATVQFPKDRAIPVGLVKKLVRSRLRFNKAKQAQKAKR